MFLYYVCFVWLGYSSASQNNIVACRTNTLSFFSFFLKVSMSNSNNGDRTEMVYVNLRNPIAKEAFVKEANDLVIARPGPVVPEVNKDNLSILRDIMRKDAMLKTMKENATAKRKESNPSIVPCYNRRFKKNNKYRQEQRDKFLELYKQHRRHYKASTYAQLVSVPTSIIYSWMKLADEGSDLQYRKDRNDFHRIVTTEKIQYISDLIGSGQDNLTEKKMAQMMKDQFHMDKEVNQSTISRLLHSKVMEEVTGKTYSLKMTVKRSKKANTEENKQHRIEVVTQLEQYLKEG